MNDTITDSPETLRAQMVDRITAAGWAQTPRVAEAMRTVPRHLFVPHAPLAEAYDDLAVITKRSADGTALSCASEPVIVAMMLDQLDVQPGHRILEIGAGTGYNAALLAFLTGPDEQVTTVDIEPDITAQARQNLDATGHHQVHVATPDGTLGDPDRAPYDRIILTVSVHLCGFVPMVGQEGERSGHIDLDGLVTLYWDEDQRIDPTTLRGVFDQPKATAWSAVTVGGEDPFDSVWLRLTSTEPGTSRIAAAPEAVKAGLCTPAIPVRSPALVEDISLAYLALRRLNQQGSPDARWELGAIGHGPTGAQLADRLCDQIRAWDHDRTAQPVITAYPARAGDDEPGNGHPIHKRASRLTVSY